MVEYRRSGFFYDNELYIYGRQKDVIVLGGQNRSTRFRDGCRWSDGVRTGCSVAVGTTVMANKYVYLSKLLK